MYIQFACVQLKLRTEAFENVKSKEAMLLEKVASIQNEIDRGVESTFQTQSAIYRMAGKKLEDFVVKLKESRGNILCTILSRILDEARAAKAAGRMRYKPITLLLTYNCYADSNTFDYAVFVCICSEIFKKIRIPYIVKKSKSMLVKQQIRNWLRICNRFNYIDRGSVEIPSMLLSTPLS